VIISDGPVNRFLDFGDLIQQNAKPHSFDCRHFSCKTRDEGTFI